MKRLEKDKTLLSKRRDILFFLNIKYQLNDIQPLNSIYFHLYNFEVDYETLAIITVIKRIL